MSNKRKQIRKSRPARSNKNARWQRWHAWVASLAGIVAILGGIGGVYKHRLTQEENRLAQERLRAAACLDAATKLQEARDIIGNAPLAVLALSEVVVEPEELKKAAQLCAEAAAECDSATPDAQLLGSIILARQERYGEALAMIQRALASIPEGEAIPCSFYTARGNIHARQEEWESALADYQHAEAAYFPSRSLGDQEIPPRLALNIGAAHEHLGEIDAALSDYGRAVELGLPEHEGKYRMASLCVEENRLPEAWRYAEECCASKTDYARGHLVKGRALLALKRYPEARASAETAIALDRLLAEAHNLLGNAFKELGKEFYDAALQSYSEAIKISPKAADFYYNRGLLWTLIQRSGQAIQEEAIQDIQRAMALDIPRARYWSTLGIAQAQSGRPAEADASFVEAVRLEPENQTWKHNLDQHRRLHPK